jgi:hypothetical protein
MGGKIVQTAGRDRLGEFAPEFAHFNEIKTQNLIQNKVA